MAGDVFMKKMTRTSALFLAVMSVYPVCGFAAGPVDKASGANGAKSAANTEVRLLDETSGPLAQADAKKDAPAAGGNSQVAVNDAGTVEIHANEANLAEVLRMIALQSQKNIITSKDVRGTVTAHLYGVTLKEALDAILKPNGFGYREKGNFIYVYTQKELAEQDKMDRVRGTKVFHLFYTPAANALPMLKPVLSTDAAIAVSLPSKEGLDTKEVGGFSHSTEDTIVVTDYMDNLDRVGQVIKEIDRKPQQVLIEATIVSARLTEDNALGIDFSIVGGVDFAGLAGAGLKSFGDAASGKTLNTDLTHKGMGAAGTGFTSSMPQNGLRLGVVSSNVAIFLNALEAVTDTSVLANPKVLTLNKQRGEVLVGREDGYLTTTVTESSSVQTVEFLQTGTRLVFRPFIGDDGYIRMEVHPEDSDGKVVGGLPTKTTTEVTTNIMVKDGHTVVIGGLFRESSAVSRSQVPGLGNLPVVGALFRQQEDATSREEIIILLTPHIVKDDKAFSDEAQGMLKDMEKLRVGVRKGMMPFGRERLAESAYDCAVAEMNKPNPDRQKALWHLDCATNLNPSFLEAIKMKERLSGHEVTTVDNSTSRDFVKRMILADRSERRADASVQPSVTLTVGNRNQQASASPAPITAAPTTQPPQPSLLSRLLFGTAQSGTTAANATPEPTVAAVPTTQPSVADSKTQLKSTPKEPEMLEENTPAVAVQPLEKAVPTTQPSNGEENARRSAVTEAPIDELPGTEDEPSDEK
jgi:type IV pilus assembly protein PilQ